MALPLSNGDIVRTVILPVVMGNLGNFQDSDTLEHWELPEDDSSLMPIREAAKALQMGDIPVGFPTETVYGLAADATRSAAVKGIYRTKGRPSDNPLIVHVCDLTMLRGLISSSANTNGNSDLVDPIPGIYKPLIKKFWPGPLTILLPNPSPSKLAPEVTAGLPTFGARMPYSPLTLSLIQLAGVPLAGPSANASTKPSPTTAEHVKHDLDGKIEIILDGGPCQVGVESTVIDGLSKPPVVLRPGGISIDNIRECEGWEGVVKGYKDQSEIGAAAPRAPGMKYKHYSPKAKVVLYEKSSAKQDNPGIPHEVWKTIEQRSVSDSELGKIGIVRTKHWEKWAGLDILSRPSENGPNHGVLVVIPQESLPKLESYTIQEGNLYSQNNKLGSQGTSEQRLVAHITEISIGNDTSDIAHGLFAALRELDLRGVDVIYVEGIEDEGDIAAAVMNRLRKAASVIET